MTQLSVEIAASVRVKNVSPLCGDAVDWHWNMIWELFREIPRWVYLYDEAWTYNSVKKGALQVWAYSDSEIRGIMATRINEFPKCKVLEVLGLSGTFGLEFMKELDDVCEHLARQQSCQYLLCSARPGMERILSRKHHAQHEYSVLVRPVGLLRRS